MPVPNWILLIAFTLLTFRSLLKSPHKSILILVILHTLCAWMLVLIFDWNVVYRKFWVELLLLPGLMLFSIINIILIFYFYNDAVVKNGGLGENKRLLARNDLFLLALLGGIPVFIGVYYFFTLIYGG